MMPARPDDFGARLSIFYACLFITLGIQLPFFPLWLEARGLDPVAIGIVLAMPIAMRIVAVPLLSRAADRAGDLRAGLIAASFAGALGFFAVGFAYGFSAILLTVVVASVAASPLMSLADAYALRGLNARKRAYGPVRLWGSTSFIGASVGAGFLLGIVSPDRLIWFIAGAFVLLGVASLLLRPLTSPSLQSPAVPIAGHRWLSPKFLAVAAAAGLVQSSHALYYGFSAVDWAGKGISSLAIGLLWALGVAAEIALFAVSARLTLTPVALLAIGAGGACIRWIAMALDPPSAILPLLQCLHAFSFGATHLGSVQFMARIAGERNAAAAQGDFATILAIGSGAATALSGLLYNAFGDAGYLAMAALALAGGLCLALSRRLRH